VFLNYKNIYKNLFRFQLFVESVQSYKVDTARREGTRVGLGVGAYDKRRGSSDCVRVGR